MKRVFVIAAFVCACSHELPLPGQVLLVVDTDALLAPGAGQTPTHAILFDMLSVDVFVPGDDDPCSGCSQQFSIDEATVNQGHASVGIPAQSGVSGYRARIRLYHTTKVGVESKPDSTIETVVALPPVDDTGEIAITVFLATDDVANPSGTLDAPVAATLGAITNGHAGTWPGGAVVPCTDTPSDDEVCIPGGAFWMGNPAASFAGGAGTATDAQRIVVVSPFFLEAYETTVADFRGQPVSGVVAWTGSTEGTDPTDWCTYSSSKSRDALPLNCISWQAASSYCHSPQKGKMLPTEAQLEFVEGGMRNTLYVWGDDDPACGDAAFGLSGFGVWFDSGHSECRLPSSFGGPLAPHRAPARSRDVLTIGDRAVYDLAGNLAEWPSDAYEPQGYDCWTSGVLHDPECTTGTARLVRGGSWVSGAENLRAAARVPRGNGDAAPDVGVRCARPDKAP